MSTWEGIFDIVAKVKLGCLPLVKYLRELGGNKKVQLEKVLERKAGECLAHK